MIQAADNHIMIIANHTYNLLIKLLRLMVRMMVVRLPGSQVACQTECLGGHRRADFCREGDGGLQKEGQQSSRFGPHAARRI